MNGKFLHDMLVNWFFIGIRTLLFLWWTITVEPVLEGTCIERPPVYKDHLEILWISSLYPQSAYMYFLWLVLSQKRCVILLQKNISDLKKGETTKVQVTKQLKCVKSLWGQEEKIYQQGCASIILVMYLKNT